jgi:hypothetical protein
MKSLVPEILTEANLNDIYGDIEDDVDSPDHDVDSTIAAMEPLLGMSMLPLADETLRNEIIKIFEQTLNALWVTVSGIHDHSIYVQTYG